VRQVRRTRDAQGRALYGCCMDLMGNGCMRVLICDQESEMLERIAREFEVDVATSKATCIDLMRANPFDVLVASERLVDGSGLELLSSVATRWPDTLRVLAIEPERRKMLGGKLAPFRLHATIRYPVDEDELERRLQELDQLLSDDGSDEDDGDFDAPSSVERAPAIPQQRPAPVVATRPNASAAQTRSTAPPVPARSNASAAQMRPASSVTTHSANALSVAVSSSTTARAAARPLGNSSTTAARPTSVVAAGRVASAGASPVRQPPVAPTVRGGKAAVHPQVTGKSYSSTATREAADYAPVRRKLGNYTPLGAPEDADLRIVAREFDESAAPIAARAIRAREEANRPRTPSEKARSVADHVSRTLKRLLKR
jgi:hypothetical protein